MRFLFGMTMTLKVILRCLDPLSRSYFATQNTIEYQNRVISRTNAH